jgi:hypothetical protein
MRAVSQNKNASNNNPLSTGKLWHTRTADTTINCSNVVILLTREGLISIDIDMKKNINMPERIIKSLLITITASQLGIGPRIASVIKDEVSNALSANGSRYVPRTVF